MKFHFILTVRVRLLWVMVKITIHTLRIKAVTHLDSLKCIQYFQEINMWISAEHLHTVWPLYAPEEQRRQVYMASPGSKLAVLVLRLARYLAPQTEVRPSLSFPLITPYDKNNFSRWYSILGIKSCNTEKAGKQKITSRFVPAGGRLPTSSAHPP
jgi:hypothetical protein